VYDIITDSPFYKSIIEKGLAQGIERGLKEGRERGLKEGLEQGLEKGQRNALRQAIVDVVHERLPALVSFAESQVPTINDTTQLRRLVVKLSTVPDTEQARQAILDAQQKQ
jgi:flagellar biosynthesis/type III secretory pathway protein FliH